MPGFTWKLNGNTASPRNGPFSMTQSLRTTFSTVSPPPASRPKSEMANTAAPVGPAAPPAWLSRQLTTRTPLAWMDMTVPNPRELPWALPAFSRSSPSRRTPWLNTSTPPKSGAPIPKRSAVLAARREGRCPAAASRVRLALLSSAPGAIAPKERSST